MEIPGYTIETELGRGGMATVYRAMQLSVERIVALKVMSPVLLVDQSFADRFLREARIAASLYHPHVVSIHDVGEHEGQPYIAMEFLGGGDLSARCSGKAMGLSESSIIVEEIAKALHYAHQKGFVHRDVKPENILYRHDGTTVLTDFGIARAVNSSTQMTKTGAVVGTPQYMSPEQARGRDLDGRSDIYGLGIVFFEMLTGSVPFHGSDSVSVGIKHVTEPIPRLPAHLSQVQPVLDRLLAKNPAERYQDGADLVAAMRALRQSSATTTTPPAPAKTTDSATRIAPEAMSNSRRTTPPADDELDATRQLPRQTTATPAETTEAQTPTPTPTTARHVSRPTPVAATPRPDGKPRQEPTMGALDDIGSLDRTIATPVFENRSPARSVPRRSRPSDGRPGATGRRRSLWPLSVLLIIGLAGAGWWQRDQVRDWFPKPEVERLLTRAQSAYEYRHYYGDTQQYANRLYQQVLRIEPDNARALNGLKLLANQLLLEAEAAIVDNDLVSARLFLRQARELGADRDRLAQLESRIVSTGGGDSQSEIIDRLLERASVRLRAGMLLAPSGDNAHDMYRQVLASQPDNPQATAGMREISRLLDEQLEAAIATGNATLASKVIGDLERLEPDRQFVAEREQIAALQVDTAGEREKAIARRQIEDLVKRADGASPENALALYAQALAIDSESAAALDARGKLLRRMLRQAETMLEDDQLSSAQTMLDQIEATDARLNGLDRARSRLELYRDQRQTVLTSNEEQELLRRLANARDFQSAGQLMEPPGSSAYDELKAALRLSSNDPRVQDGLRSLSNALLAMMRESVDSASHEQAYRRFLDAEQVDPFNPALATLRPQAASAARSAGRDMLVNGNVPATIRWLEAASTLDPDHPDLARLQLEISVFKEQ